jgi:NADH-quinone oxidoreductase subunit M
MLKLGGVGLLRILRLTKIINPTPLLFPCFLGLLFAPFLCSSQVDHKKFAAYSSVTHINRIALAKFTCGGLGESYSLILLISHGYASSLMFVYIGSFYHSNIRRMILYFEGIRVSSIGFVSLFSVVILSNKAVPPFISF